jgi:uncharacterized protein with HEPN domain
MPSKTDDPKRWLLDIKQNIELALQFADGVAYEQFRDDMRTFYAVTRCLEIISEASRRLPADLKERHVTIPWAQMAGAGNVYRHDYEDVEQKFIWQAVQHRLPELLRVVEQELGLFP